MSGFSKCGGESSSYLLGVLYLCRRSGGRGGIGGGGPGIGLFDSRGFGGRGGTGGLAIVNGLLDSSYLFLCTHLGNHHCHPQLSEVSAYTFRLCPLRIQPLIF